MSMYDMVLGDGQQAMRGAVLRGLLLGRPPVPRFRDAWAEKGADGPEVHLYTRQGGPRRSCTCAGGSAGPAHRPGSCIAACNEALQAHPLYLRDADDEFDSTYASFYFRSPDDPEIREALTAIAVSPVDTAARWREAIARGQAGDLPPALVAAGDQVLAAIADTSPGAPKVIRI